MQQISRQAAREEGESGGRGAKGGETHVGRLVEADAGVHGGDGADVEGGDVDVLGHGGGARRVVSGTTARPRWVAQRREDLGPGGGGGGEIGA